MTVRDPELLLELRDEPELLAVADALSTSSMRETPPRENGGEPGWRQPSP